MLDWIKKATGRTIQGNHKFYIKSQPQNVDTGTTITINAFTDSSETAVVPCQYRWFRIRNNLVEECVKVKGNIYVCDTSDIGAMIQAQITGHQSQYSGQAKVRFGPVKLSPQLKKHLMDTLTNGSTFIRGMICLNEVQQRQCQFKIFQDSIKIVQLQSQIGYNFHYSQFQPRIQLIQKDSTKLVMNFSQNYQSNPNIFLKNLFNLQQDQIQKYNNQSRIQIRFPSKLIKQMFYLTLKAFTTKRQLKNSVIMHRIQQLYFNQNQNIDLLLEIQSLRSDVSRLYYNSEQKQKQKVRLSQEVHKLQRQIQEIVTTYTRMTQDKLKNSKQINDGYSILTTKRDEVFGRKCQNLQRQNLNLNQRLKLLTAQIDQIRLNSSMAQKNQTMVSKNPNLTHVTTIKMGNPSINNMTSFQNILQDLAESRVTSFTQDSFLINKKLQKANQQKVQLQKKLQRSFRTIDQLQKKLKNQSQQFSNSAVQFNFGKKQVPLEINTSSYSMTVDLDKIKQQNKKLSCLNQSLLQQNKNLKKQVASSSSRIVMKQPPMPIPVQFNQDKQSLKASIARQQNLSFQNQNIKKQNSHLKKSLMAEQAKGQSFYKQKINLQKKVESLTKQLQLYKQKQQVLNRSQNLSMYLQDSNQQKIKVLKQNNQFLLNQNQRLNKICQKFMNEAKQNTKLRKQILQLKQKLRGKLLNPERSEQKSIYTGTAALDQSNNSQLHTSNFIGNVLTQN